MRLGVIRFGAVVEISCVDVGNDGSTVAGVDEIGIRVLKVVSQHRWFRHGDEDAAHPMRGQTAYASEKRVVMLWWELLSLRNRANLREIAHSVAAVLAYKSSRL